MTLGETMSKAALKATQMGGVQATLVDPAAAYATTGTVTEGPVEYAVWASSVRDESRRWQEPSITGTVYVSARGISAKPQPGWRLKHGGRVFVVIAVLPNTVNDTVIDWRLDVGEVAA